MRFLPFSASFFSFGIISGLNWDIRGGGLEGGKGSKWGGGLE